ncbi:MAG: amidase [Betaproteobacteria bacterium]|nr:amidase [Betaproteobacteria bacterium]
MPADSTPTATVLNRLTATEIVAAVRSGRTTCEAVTRACLERIAERDALVQAWQYLNPDQAIAEAKERDRSTRGGPLIGVPFSVKDIIDTSDMPTEYGSPIYSGHRPRADASCVALSRKAGGVLLGKAVTTEFANVHPSRTRNPHDLSRTPGGSSSGSAAAVADHMVALSIGSQTSGSTVRPASYCGVFGYRPTFGDLRCVGIKEAAGSFDTLGLLARSVEDIALYRDVLLGIEPVPVAADVPAPRVGFCRTHLWSLLESSTQQLFENAARKLADAGAKVSNVELPKNFEGIPDAHRLISGFEFSRNFAWEIEHHWEKISTTLRDGRIHDGLTCSFSSYLESRALAERCRQLITPILENYDVLLTACATGEAPVGFSTTGNTKLALIWTTIHVPAISVPAFTGPNGMPIGAYIVGKRNRDRELFAFARWIHRKLA